MKFNITRIENSPRILGFSPWAFLALLIIGSGIHLFATWGGSITIEFHGWTPDYGSTYYSRSGCTGTCFDGLYKVDPATGSPTYIMGEDELYDKEKINKYNLNVENHLQALKLSTGTKSLSHQDWEIESTTTTENFQLWITDSSKDKRFHLKDLSLADTDGRNSDGQRQIRLKTAFWNGDGKRIAVIVHVITGPGADLSYVDEIHFFTFDHAVKR